MKGGDYSFAVICLACCLCFGFVVAIHEAKKHDDKRDLNRKQIEQSKAELAAVLEVITNSPRYKEILILQTNKGGAK